MSLKNIFSSSPKIVASQSLDTAGAEVESGDFITEKVTDIQRFIPPIDYEDPKNFAKFGLAQKYYNDAYVRISNQYPYDGSLKEKTQFFNTSSNFDKWIFDNKYPRYTGYVNFSPTGWGSLNGSKVSGYGLPATLNYIYIKGGPNTSGSTLVDKFKSSNFYSEEYKRASNLYYDLSGSGVTVEFWLNKPAFDSTKTEKEVIFDLWNNIASSSTNYARLTIELTSSTSDTSAFYITAQSGTAGYFRQKLGNITVAQLTSSAWQQYSIILENTGSSINTQFYVNGNLNNSFITGTALSPVTGAMLATIGSLVNAVSGTATSIGYGKLSGSIDEFRYWKTARTEKDIKYNWFVNVNGGTNTDDANTDLGVYYKFNEGIVGTSSYDAVILDYSGRTSNGTFIGYVEECRDTNSALSINGFSEPLDPVVYQIHPQYTSSLQTLVDDSFEYDTENNAAVYNYLPQWIREDEDANGEGLLPNLVQTVAAYFDNLYHQISYINKIKNINYTSGSDKPITFANRLLENYGLVTPELFVDAEIIETFADRTPQLIYSSSLSDIKNKIYINIYNNIVNILKQKGTEKAYRNLIRCFGVDADLIKMNLYADNTTYTLKDNTYSTAVKKKFVDFNDVDRFDTTVYQASDTSISSSLSYIPGNISASYMGLTAETEVIFPYRFPKGNPLYIPYLFQSSSLFGMHQANSSSDSDYTWNGTDDINFQVYAVRTEEESPNVYFQISDYNNNLFLTSSAYTNVYDNTKWNFAVRVRPDKYENIDLVSQTSASTYTLEFYGVKTNLDTVEQEFMLTSSLSNTQGKKYFTNAKRFYIGSHVLNFTSSQNVLTRTDTKISTLRYWQSYLDNEAIKAHSKDASNYGSLNPYKNAYVPSLTSISGTYVPQIETLALNWDFTTVSSSDAGNGNPTSKVAQFTVPDSTSGSLDTLTRYGWLGDILNHQYTGRGDFFLPNETQVVNTEYVFSAKQQLPESLDTLDTIQILQQDDLAFTRETRPANYFYTFEKSMYQNISEEMLNMFGTIVEFNNLIGEPVNRYRQEYKDMAKLRQLFFEKVQNVPSLDKFIDFYKWLDSAISVFITQLTPASANVSEKIFNVVESHILERNKYWNKFPTIEFKGTDPEAGIQSINKLLYNWRYGHRPLTGLEADNADYWLNRAERDTTPLSSSISASNFSRSRILSVATSVLNRSYTTPMRYVVDQPKTIRGGTNFHQNKNIEFLRIATAPHGPMDADSVINVPANILFVGVKNTGSLIKNINDVKNPNEKIKYSFDVIQGRDYLSSSLGYGEILKSDIAIPANFISGNITSGYNAEVASNFMQGVIITNLHNDSYGPSKETPIQGPFTNTWVGGLQYRHVDINRGSDNYTTRPEGWMLLLGTGSITSSAYQTALGFVGADYPYPEGNPDEPSYPVRDHARGYYYREETVKRPLNIRNISYSTSSYSLGNYRFNYEVLSSVGRTNNNMLLTDETGTVNLAQTELRGIVRTAPNSYGVNFTLPTRPAYKTIIGNRFSAPGEIRTLSRGYLNRFAEEMSAYNAMPFRNKQVIGDARRVNDSLTIEEIGNIIPNIITGAIGIPYNTLLARHSVFGGFQSGSSVIPSIHKTNKNPVYVYNDNGAKAINDNGFISHQIPRKDSGYSWIVASLTAGITSGNVANFGFVNNFATVPSGTTSTVQTLPLVSVSDVGLNATGQFVVTGAVLSVDSVGLNTIFSEQVTVDTLGTTGSLTNATSSLVTSITNSGALFNALMINRNGLYQYPTFKQIFRNNHPVVKYQINHTQIGALKSLPQLEVGNNNTISLVGRKENRFFTEPFVIYRKPLIASLGYDDGKNKSNVQITFSNQNETEYFCNDELNFLLGLVQCERKSYNKISKLYLKGGLESTLNPINKFNILRYEESIYPAAINKFKTIVRKRTNYDNQFWRDLQRERISSNLVSSFGIVSQSMWALDADEDFNIRTTARSGLTGNGSGILQNNHVFYSPTVVTIANKKISPLYARKHMIQHTSSVNAATGIQKTILTSSIPIGFGEAKWTANTNAVVLNADGTQTSSSINPFYDSYDDYSDDLFYLGKNGSLIPEFRIENNVSKYLTTKDVNVLNNFSIIGADTNYSGNTSNTFYRTYTNSEFMKNFSVVRDEHKEIVDPTKLTLECNAYIKFNAYKGFFPADRTTQLSEQFSSSYLPYVSSSVASSSFPDSIKHRNFITPFITPGLLYNTIKSGIAVDYAILEKPVFNNSDATSLNYQAINVANYNGSGSNYMIVAKEEADATIDRRLPFEALLEPETYVKNYVLYDFESHPSASTNVRYEVYATPETSSKSKLASNGDTQYKYMVNNFLSEVVDFFLQDNKLSSISSKPESSLNLFLNSGSVYGARLKMYRSMNKARNYYPSDYELPQDPDANFDAVALASVNGANAGYVSTLRLGYSNNTGLSETFTMYSRPSGFGPDFAGSDLSSSTDASLLLNTSPTTSYARDARTGFNPIYTPPYYYGEAWADIIFKVTTSKEYKIQEIINESTINYLRFDTQDTPWTGSATGGVSGTIKVWSPTNSTGSNPGKYFMLSKNTVNSNSMQLSASLNIQNYKSVAATDIQDINAVINTIDRVPENTYIWNIETKFETPMLNFANVSINSDESATDGSETIPLGMWHQFGKIPQDNEGVYMQVQSIPKDWLKYNPLASTSTYYNGSTSIQDLTKLVGFSNIPVKLGKIQKTKKVYEAIVAVPFIEEGGIKKFFEIPKEVVDVLLGVKPANSSTDPGDSLIQMVSYLDKYVFPPMFDFKKNSSITPISMYVFEFDYDLDQNDLSYIWQNLPPVNSRKVEKKTASISHKLLYNELMGHANALKNQTIDSNIQWMVFKIKQRAKYDYSKYLSSKNINGNNKSVSNALSIFNNENENLFENVEYSYNWPYDYFSLVELAEIKATIDFEKPDDISSDKIFTSNKLTSTNGKSMKQVDLSEASNIATNTNLLNQITETLSTSATETNKSISTLASTLSKGIK
jgi:hypothetical protein